MSLAVVPFDQSDKHELLREDRTKPLSKWRLALAAISSSRAFVSSVYERKKSDATSHSSSGLSYVSIDIEREIKSDVTRETLTKVVEDEDLRLLEELGGVEGIAVALDTSLESGTSQHIARQREKFGANTIKNPARTSLLRFVWRGLLDRDVFILAACGAFTLGFGIPVNGWEGGKEGGSIFAAIFLAISVVVWSEYWWNEVLAEMHKAANNVQVEVVRGGHCQQVPMLEIVVGDVVFLKPGDRVPGHGLVIENHSLKLDRDGAELTSMGQQVFLHSGMRVVDGFARMLVTSVGLNRSRIYCDCRDETTLQLRLKSQLKALDLVTDFVGYALFLIFLLLISTEKIGVLTYTDEYGNEQPLHGMAKINAIVSNLVAIITTVVNIPDIWILSLTLNRACAVKKLIPNSALVLKPSALEALSYATTICIEDSRVLTTNKTKVTKFWLPSRKELLAERDYQLIIPTVKEFLKEGIALNRTSSLAKKAILSWATTDLKMDVEEVKRNLDIIESHVSDTNGNIIPILAKRKTDDDNLQVHWFGAAELILPMCSRYYDATGIAKDIDNNQTTGFKEIINGMAESGLTCIAFAYKQVPKEELTTGEPEKRKKRLTLLGVVGISNPCQSGVENAVKACRNSGVSVKLITRDDISVAKLIATDCAILAPTGGKVIEGADFQKLPPQERMDQIDEICVMASSTTSDKLLMIKCLKEKGGVVAIIRDATNNDTTVAKEADIVLSTGIDESADIVVLDGDFASVPKLLSWGRCIYSNIQKFIQFQLTVNFVGLVANFVSALLGHQVPLTTIQLLWVSLVTDTLGALAFSREKPREELMTKPPVRKKDPLVTNIMLRNILPQTLYQIVLLLTLNGTSNIFNLQDDKVKLTFLFNSFLLCQVFNEFNSRKLEEKNVFQGIQTNKLFLAIVAFTVVLQVLLVEILKKLVDTERLNWSQWGICAGIAFATLPIGLVARLIPVPKKEVVSYIMVLGQIKDCVKRPILMIWRSLSLWTSRVLLGMEGNQRRIAGVAEE